MSPTATALTDHPRIWACNISRLSDLFLDIAAEYNDRAELCIITRDFEGIMHGIDAAGAERSDMVVAGGSNGAYLKPYLSLPVVVINPTGFDVMYALARARHDTESAALVIYGDTPEEVRRFVAAYGMDMVFASYTSHQGAESCVLDLRNRGVGMVVDPGLMTDLATQTGINAVFLHPRDSVCTAFDTALEAVQATHREALCRRRLDNLLQYLRDGVATLGVQGRVEAINQRLTTALGIEAEQAIGQPLFSIAPSPLGLLPNTDGDTLDTVQGVDCVIYRGPLTSTGIGVAEDIVFTFQESRAVERLDRTLRSRQRPQQLSVRCRLEDLAGESLAMERVRTLIRRYVRSGATVLVLNESGTDKEMVAQDIHQLSAQHNFPFIIVNHGAFPEALLENELFGYEEDVFTGVRKGSKTGLIEAAHHGTLFLDEIGEMPLPLQGCLLHILQEHRVVRLDSTEPTCADIRVVAATHHALTDAVEADTFRADLYYRLNIFSIGLPPLRERPDDMTPLAAELLVQTMRRKPRLLLRIADTEDTAHVLAGIAEPLGRYAWAGNMYELQNMVERIAVELVYTGDTSTATQDVLRLTAPEAFAHATPGKPATLTLCERSGGVEVKKIHAAPAAHGGNRGVACATLGISKTTLWRQLQEAALIR